MDKIIPVTGFIDILYNIIIFIVMLYILGIIK